jgi:hypothetical protein
MYRLISMAAYTWYSGIVTKPNVNGTTLHLWSVLHAPLYSLEAKLIHTPVVTSKFSKIWNFKISKTDLHGGAVFDVPMNQHGCLRPPKRLMISQRLAKVLGIQPEQDVLVRMPGKTTGKR